MYIYIYSNLPQRPTSKLWWCDDWSGSAGTAFGKMYNCAIVLCSAVLKSLWDDCHQTIEVEIMEHNESIKQ